MPLPRRALLTGLAAFAVWPSLALGAVQKNIPYGTHPLQRYDVYMPAQNRIAPLVVFMHGGGWQSGDKNDETVWKVKSAHWNAQGLGFVALNTRQLAEADPLQQASDLARALAHIQHNARNWGGDPERIALMGHAAGAHLVALLGADPGLARQWGARPWRATIPLDTALYDTERFMRRRPLRLHRRAFGDSPAFWRNVSPRERLSSGAPPFLLVCSKKRPDVLPQAKSFARMVKAKGGTAGILPLNMSQAEINTSLGLPGAYTAQIDAFLAAHGLAKIPVD